MQSEIERTLESAPLLRGFSVEDLELLSKSFRAERVPGGSVLFREGERGDRLYLLAEGNVLLKKAIRGGRAFASAELAPVAVFGEASLLLRSPRWVTAEASEKHEQVLVLTLDQATFRALRHAHPGLYDSLRSAIVFGLLHRFRSQRALLDKAAARLSERTGEKA